MPHTHEKLCPTVTAYLTLHGKVLLGRSRKYKLWLPVGGHIESGEDPEEALFREISEETGFGREDVEPHIWTHDAPVPEASSRLLLTPSFLDRHAAGDREHYGLVYMMRVCAKGKEVVTCAEYDEMRWFGFQELQGIEKEKIQERTRWQAQCALELERSKIDQDRESKRYKIDK